MVNSYSEDQSMHTFLDNVQQRGICYSQIAMHQEEFEERRKNC